VEGHELAVLQGAVRTIASCHPTLLIEAADWHRPGAVMSVSSFLMPPYRGWFSFGGQRRSIVSGMTTPHCPTR
jgi:hypothetical protein